MFVSWTVAMFEALRRKIAIQTRGLAPVRAVRRFARHQEGVAAVEFAFIAVPFFALLFAILQTALIFFSGQTLEAAVADSARLILTGQAQTGVSTQTGNVGWTQQDFKDAVCARSFGMFDCQNQLYVDVKSYSSFATINTSSRIDSSKNFDTSNMSYTPGNPGDIVVVTLYYQWPIAVTLLNSSLANVNGQKRLLIATSVFRNEPYQ